jgi:hypothetical protein
MSLPALTSLGIPHLILSDAMARAMIANPALSALTTLEVRLVPRSIAALEILLDSPALPSLRHLRVHHWTKPAVVTALVASPVLDRLASLTLEDLLVSPTDRAIFERRLGARFSTTARPLEWY